MSDLIITRGDTRVLNVAVTDAVTGAAINLTGATGLVFTVKAYDSATAVLTKTLSTGVAVTNAAGGLASITLSAAETAVLTGQYAWDLQLTDAASLVSTVAAGSLWVTSDVTAGTLTAPLLTGGQVRGYLATTLMDGDLQRLIAIAEAEVAARIGPVGSATEIIDGLTHRIVLSRPALTITSITETDTGTTTTTLAANDYSLRSPYVLERLTTGTNAAQTWNYRATVTYTPVDDILLRQGVVIDLVRMYVNRNPGLSSFTIGSWSETYSSHGEYDSEREAILARLDPAPKMRIV